MGSSKNCCSRAASVFRCGVRRSSPTATRSAGRWHGPHASRRSTRAASPHRNHRPQTPSCRRQTVISSSRMAIDSVLLGRKPAAASNATRNSGPDIRRLVDPRGGRNWLSDSPYAAFHGPPRSPGTPLFTTDANGPLLSRHAFPAPPRFMRDEVIPRSAVGDLSPHKPPACRHQFASLV